MTTLRASDSEIHRLSFSSFQKLKSSIFVKCMMKSTVSKLFTALPNPDSIPKSSLLYSDLLITQKTHALILKSGTPIHQSNLVFSYCNQKAFSQARQLFDESPEWDLFCTTAIITFFGHQNRHRDAVSLFCLMLLRGVRPNQFTFGTVLHSSTALHDLAIGKQLHACVMKMGLQSDVFVGSSVLDHYVKMGVIDEGRRAFDDICLPNVVSYTALVSGYIKNNQLDEAFRLFEEMPERTVVTWNAMISGFCQMGLHEESVNLFVEMRRVGVAPSSSTFTCILTAAACISALAMGRSFHADTVKVLAKLDVYVGNSLLSFYARCGCLEDGILVFEGLEESNIVSWNAVIWGYAQNGKGEEALETFKRIESGSLRPNDVTLLGLLFGCNHSGLVDEGITIFNRMREEDPSIVKPEHYASVVDLLSRSGRLPEAEKFLKELPFEPGLGFWKSLLGGCQIHRKKELAMRVSERILEVNQHDISSFVLLSNVQSSVGHWDNVSSIRRKMLEKGVKRVPGCSWIEVQGRLHVFFNGDRRHSQADDIYFLLRIMPYQGEQSALFN